MIELLPKYKTLNNKDRYTIITGGRGSAKSFHVSLFLLMLTYQKDEVILFTRYTMISAKKSIIPEFREKIEMMDCENHFIVKDTEIINRLTGSKILFSGIKASSGNQTANLKSINGLTCWVVDEAEEMVKEDEFDRIDESIRKKGTHNRVMIVMNPCEKQHFIYKRFFQKGNVEDTTYIHTTYLDNLKNLSDGFIRLAERTKERDEDKYKRTYLGEWGGAHDLVFDKGFELYDKELTGYTWKRYGGDFGFVNDPTVMVEVIRDGRNLYLKEIIREVGLRNEDISNLIKGNADPNELGIWDSAEKKSIIDLQAFGCYVTGARKGSDSVHYGINRMKEFKIFIHKDSVRLIDEFESYSWKKLANGDYALNTFGHRIPNDKNNHGIDAARYAVTYFDYE